MKLIVVLFFLTFLGISGNAQKCPCLPAGIKEDVVVKFVTSASTNGSPTNKPVTVKQTLTNIKARCRRGKLVDRNGRQIRFYFLKGCWGNPPPDYLEIIEKQRTELEALKKKYTVIEITCSSGSPQRIS